MAEVELHKMPQSVSVDLVNPREIYQTVFNYAAEHNQLSPNSVGTRWLSNVDLLRYGSHRLEGERTKAYWAKPVPFDSQLYYSFGSDIRLSVGVKPEEISKFLVNDFKNILHNYGYRANILSGEIIAITGHQNTEYNNYHYLLSLKDIDIDRFFSSEELPSSDLEPAPLLEMQNFFQLRVFSGLPARGYSPSSFFPHISLGDYTTRLRNYAQVYSTILSAMYKLDGGSNGDVSIFFTPQGGFDNNNNLP